MVAPPVDPPPAVLVSVIIPVFNHADELEECLTALRAQQDAPPFEVVVCDNGSSPPVVPEPAGLHLIRVLEETPGSYAARNAAVAASHGSILLFTDADCRPTPDWVREGARAVNRAPHDVQAGHIEVVVTRSTLATRYEQEFAFDQSRYAELGFAATANMAVHRAVFDQVGPFDVRLRSSGDREWGRRATLAGHQVTYAAGLRVQHPARATIRALIRKQRRITGGKHLLTELGLEHPTDSPAVVPSPPPQLRDGVGRWLVMTVLGRVRRFERRRLRRGGLPRR